MSKVRKNYVTDEQVEQEIERLAASDNVKLAKMEQKIKYRRRQYLYMLRSLEKRGAELRSEGIDEANIEAFVLGFEQEEEYEA